MNDGCCVLSWVFGVDKKSAVNLIHVTFTVAGLWPYVDTLWLSLRQLATRTLNGPCLYFMAVLILVGMWL